LRALGPGGERGPQPASEFYSQLDERASWFYEAAGLSEGKTTNTLGEGQVYLSSYRDANGQWFDGGKATERQMKLIWTHAGLDGIGGPGARS
jgi:hypothetical protein